MVKKSLIYMVVSLLFLSSSLLGEGPELDEKTALNNANTAFSNGDYDGTISQITQFLDKFPNSTNKDQAYFILGESHFKLNHLPEAKAAYKEIVDKFVTSTFYLQARIELAYVSYNLGELDQAEVLLEELLDQVKDPLKLLEIYDKLFEIMNKKEDWVQAIDFLIQKQKLVSSQDDFQQINNKIISLVQSKLDKRALWKLTARYSKNFPSDFAYLQLISLYEQDKDTFHFEKTVKRFVDLYPKNEYGEILKQKSKLINEQIKKHKVVVGVILPSIRQAEDIADQVINGLNLALWDYQRSTKDESIGIAFKETSGQAGKILNETESFIKEYSPRAVIGPLFSRDFESVGALADSYSILFITPTATRPGITLHSKFLFRNGLTNPAQAKEIADYGMTKGGMKRVVIFYPKNSYGQELSKEFGEEVTRLGGEIIADIPYPPDTSDYSNEIKQIINIDLSKYGIQGEKTVEKDFKHKIKREYVPGFDSIFIPGEGLRAGLIPSQLAFFDIKGVALYGSNGWNSLDFLKAGGRFLEGAVFPDGFFVDSPAPKVVQFVESYRKTFQSEPTIFSAQSFDSMNLIIQAVKNGAVNGAQIKASFLSMNPYEGVTGTIRFGPDGEAEKKPFILQIKNGKLQQIN